MLQNEGLSPLKCMAFFIIPIVKSNTQLFLDTSDYTPHRGIRHITPGGRTVTTWNREVPLIMNNVFLQSKMTLVFFKLKHSSYFPDPLPQLMCLSFSF